MRSVIIDHVCFWKRFEPGSDNLIIRVNKAMRRTIVSLFLALTHSEDQILLYGACLFGDHVCKHYPWKRNINGNSRRKRPAEVVAMQSLHLKQQS